MKRLLYIELQKIYKNKASKILTITYFGLLTLLSLIGSIEFDLGPIHVNVAEQGVFNFPYIWHFNTYIAAILKIFLAVVIVSMMSNEYSYGTLKQNLIDGMSKKEFITSKFLTVVLFAVVSTIFVFVVSFILGLFFSDFNETAIIFSEMNYLFAYFIKLVTFFSFCLFLGILIKRSAFAIGFLILWWIVEGISYAFIGGAVLHNFDKANQIFQFLPLHSMSNLIVEPFSKLKFIKSVGSQIGVENAKDYAVHWYTILIPIIWTIIFTFLSYKLLKKRDL
jgi:ABC-type transport system involved in multi-copper enzyme maturation permease subunit